LVEQGEISTDDSLDRFIPDYPRGHEITLNHLLSHFSGIPNINNFPEYETWSKFLHTPAVLVDKFKHQPLDFAPGTRYQYSNSNYNLLAYLIELVSGQHFQTFVRTNILDVLGLNDTGHSTDGTSLLKNRAAGYMPVGLTDFENAPYLNWSIKAGNGSMYSTVDDLFRWDRALYTDQILPFDLIQSMYDDGFGWFSTRQFSRRRVHINGRSPGFTAQMARYLDDDVCIIVLSNIYAPVVDPIARDLAAILFDEPYELPAAAKPITLPPDRLDQFVGHYRYGEDFFTPNMEIWIKADADALRYCWDGGDSVLTVIGERTFFSRFFWGKIGFLQDENGRTTHLYYRYDEDYLAERIG
jgi:CubicO group peptidase (beta-lactamase class C family)